VVAIVTFLMILGSLVLILGWIGLSIYAMVKAIGSAPDAANPEVVVLLFVGLVSAFTVFLAVAVALAGRAMTPKRRKRRDAEQLTMDLEG
jgi:membrane protein implicated in regulation of membrane protease activity